ncbi:MAG: SPOR domain-containing protein [Candidatus Desulfatibia sp.]|uniref:SPOR domain-containing protein n=1 Tax=Candidatus Desulfatibia sp. TaxID=3101189 RepID=UPI002F2F4C01
MSKKGKGTPKKKSAPVQTRKGRALWIGLFFFACGWMFVLGILVGRGTAPVQFDTKKLQEELASLKAAVIKRERLRFKIDPDAAGHRTDMDFYEGLKKSERGAEHKKKQLQVASKQNKKSLPTTADLERKNRDTREKVNAVDSSRKGPPSESGSGAEIGKKITIQVAALRDPKVADRMVARLKDKWYPAYRTVAEIPGKGVWYRVRIGSFRRKAEAQSTLERLKKDKIDAILLPQ